MAKRSMRHLAESVEAQIYYEHHMCHRFPQLSYGRNNWKASHMVATENYSSWYGKHVGRVAKVKDELAVSRAPCSQTVSVAININCSTNIGTQEEKSSIDTSPTDLPPQWLEIGKEATVPPAMNPLPVCISIHRSLLLIISPLRLRVLCEFFRSPFSTSDDIFSNPDVAAKLIAPHASTTISTPPTTIVPPETVTSPTTD